MKIRKIVTVLIVFLMLSSCENSQKYFDSAKEKFNTGKFEEALKDIQFVKRTNNYTLKQKATDLENRIQDTLLIINYYSMKENRNDNIYMDFLFNMKEYEVKKHANKLIKANTRNIDEIWRTLALFIINDLICQVSMMVLYHRAAVPGKDNHLYQLPSCIAISYMKLPNILVRSS